MYHLASIATQYATATTDLDLVQAWRVLRDCVNVQAWMVKKHLSISYVPYQPYADHFAMFADLRKRKIQISTQYLEHPVFTEDDNLDFRLVHDVTHFAAQADFTWQGEVTTYERHKAVLLAFWPDLGTRVLRALFTEIVGQAAYAIHTGTFGEQKLTFLDEVTI